MKLLVFFLFFSTVLHAQNIIRVNAVLVPNTGSFVATSEKARGRLLKRGEDFTADRISVFADSFRTDNGLRDKHFAEYIGGGPKLPHSRIDITELKGTKGTAKANITINGITKPVDITYTAHDKYVDAKFEVLCSSFNLPKAQYLGIGVEDKVKVSVQYYFEKK
ncbi:YceI family protein [Peredibacter starrii]|uniref:YceI family protein n=1 Tax=Peredibacter starrii TaxID=28202 RepID=A0AAX4HS94_9BACT|nr:YceI family protein [Peredibacter starrii]WPU66122.1 YceI family protein [Peredibacter starrii]